MQVQVTSDDSFVFNLYNYGGQGIGHQRLETGFDVYEGARSYDYFWFHFSIDMPVEFFNDGEVIYQWATFDDQENDSTYSIGCKSVVGDPHSTEV